MLENLNMDEIRKITQANDFIESPFSQEFTASELKIFEGLTAECIQDDINLYKSKQNKVVRFTTKHLSSLLNTSISSISHEAERISKSLATKHIHARKVSENGQVEFVTIGIIPFASYIDGIFEVELNYKLIPYFINIDRPYTQFYLHNISVLKSAYAIKLYKLLYQYKNIKYRKFLIEELRKQFGITDKYQLYGSFKQIVIETSIKQINEKTDLDVEYTEIKVGRKVESLEFRFHLKKKQSIKSGNIKSEIIDVEPIERSDVLLVNSTDYSSIDVLLGHRADDISSKTKDLIVRLLVDRGEIFVECSIDYAKKNAKSNFEKYLLIMSPIVKPFKPVL